MTDLHSMPTQQIRDKMEPINDFIFSHLHFIFILLGIVLILLFVNHLRAYLFYRKFKGKNEETNKWFDWSAYYEYFGEYQKRKQREETEKIIARQDRRAKNRYSRKTDQNNG